MTLPTSGSLILGYDGTTTNNISNEFSSYPTVVYNDMASFQGVYYGLSGSEYRFPVSGNSIAMNLFYGTNKITGGSASYGSSQTIIIPVYNTITITCVGGNGGNGGATGYNLNGCTGSPAGGSGSAGGTSSFGGYVSAAGGGGGGPAAGGSPGTTTIQTYTNPLQGGSGPTSGSNISVTIGSGGAGGTGGCQYYQLYSTCNCWNRASNGATGSDGYISISWT